MWIAIMTLSMAGAIYYLVFFYRHVQANSTHRLASLVRASIAVSRGNTASQNVRKIIQESLGRARVLMLITALFILCWYPLFTLTLIDPKFAQPTKIYKLLTFIAWSNAALNPLVLILFDRNINVFRRIPCCSTCCCIRGEYDEEDRASPLMSGGGACGGGGGGERGGGGGGGGAAGGHEPVSVPDALRESEPAAAPHRHRVPTRRLPPVPGGRVPHEHAV